MPYELNEEPPIEPLGENVMVIPQDLVSEYRQGEVLKPKYHTKHGHNHLLYGLAVDWGDQIPVGFRRLENRDYEDARQSLWALNEVAEPCKTVVAFGQKMMKPLHGIGEEHDYGLVKVQNLILAMDYDDHDFEDTSDVDSLLGEPGDSEFVETL